MAFRSKNIPYMSWPAQSASAKPVNNLAIPRVPNVELIFLQRFPDVLEDSLFADPANIFFRFHLTFPVSDVKHMLKTIPDHYEMYLHDIP